MSLSFLDSMSRNLQTRVVPGKLVPRQEYAQKSHKKLCFERDRR